MFSAPTFLTFLKVIYFQNIYKFTKNVNWQFGILTKKYCLKKVNMIKFFYTKKERKRKMKVLNKKLLLMLMTALTIVCGLIIFGESKTYADYEFDEISLISTIKLQILVP